MTKRRKFSGNQCFLCGRQCVPATDNMGQPYMGCPVCRLKEPPHEGKLALPKCPTCSDCVVVAALNDRIAELEAALVRAERELEGCVTVDSALAVQDELQRECDAWRALATGLAGEEELMFANLPDAFRVFCAADVGEGSSWGAAAADLAERLGLIARGKTDG